MSNVPVVGFLVGEALGELLGAVVKETCGKAPGTISWMRATLLHSQTLPRVLVCIVRKRGGRSQKEWSVSCWYGK